MKNKAILLEKSLEKERDEHILTTRKFFSFVQDVIAFHENYRKFITEINTLVELDKLYKDAEDYYMEIIKDSEKQAEENHKAIIQAIEGFSLIAPKKKKAKKISRYL